MELFVRHRSEQKFLGPAGELLESLEEGTAEYGLVRQINLCRGWQQPAAILSRRYEKLEQCTDHQRLLGLWTYSGESEWLRRKYYPVLHMFYGGMSRYHADLAARLTPVRSDESSKQCGWTDKEIEAVLGLQAVDFCRDLFKLVPAFFGLGDETRQAIVDECDRRQTAIAIALEGLERRFSKVRERAFYVYPLESLQGVYFNVGCIVSHLTPDSLAAIRADAAWVPAGYD